jgi:hypothetical protein
MIVIATQAGRPLRGSMVVLPRQQPDRTECVLCGAPFGELAVRSGECPQSGTGEHIMVSRHVPGVPVAKVG